MNYLLIDLGYFLHFRYFATKSWYKRAKDYINDERMKQDPIFQEILKKRVRESIFKLVKDLNINHSNIIFCKDCKQSDIWRRSLFPNYKLNRKNLNNVKTEFCLIHEIIKNLTEIKLGSLLEHPKAEADDIVYCIRKYIKNHINKNAKFYIIASDNDYYQLCDENTYLKRLDKRNAMNNSLGNPDNDLLLKIIMGDKSDNIPSIKPKCGMKTALNLLKDPILLDKLFKQDKTIKDRFDLNKQIIDMNNIPIEYKKTINHE